MGMFDNLPEVRKPNPLPCGCGIFAVGGLDRRGEYYVYRDSHIRFCPMHVAAPDLLAACKALREATLNLRGAIVAAKAMYPGVSEAFGKAFEADDLAQAAINKAEAPQ